ncbi:ferredoxin [Nakamurella lactea]|uniref:ferredoxin n=1 Tax=Nakamurella lactea TaxID=459515 RepID=UPI00040D0DBE|nr:ferredoxin [Nakamurella lactea]
MRIAVDRTLCDGFGLCVVHAPETFSADEWGYVSLAAGDTVAPEHQTGVRRALLDCPVHAIVELDAQGRPPRRPRTRPVASGERAEPAADANA